ncbi:hypothetical protein [Cerasicoccus fimbriatus]|uniref:hypothetical protein n=1 Tax=Cerasicoccus fimbriatus TaxID=3014554 RepID=UPI0022B2D07A|nr:hypothetical protein [Cerasicoccus sp. TK19100]
MDIDIKQKLLDLYHATFSIENPQWWYWWLGAAGVILVLILLFRIRNSGKNFRVFRDESGVAETTNAALRDLVRIACDGVETASKPKIHFKKKHGRINVDIRAKLYQGQRLGEVRDQMRRRVTKIFQDTHGILVGDVSFTATGFKKSSNAPALGHDFDEPEPKPVVITEAPKAEPKAEPAPEKKPAFGSASLKQPEGPKPSKEEPKDEPAEEAEPKKKGGLFGGFGSKKNQPAFIEEAPKKDAGDPLEDDEFSALLAENDDLADKKSEDKK